MGTKINDMPVEIAAGGLITRYAEYGDMAVRHATIPAGTDMTPVLVGLPGDRCPSPHWGMVLDGSLTLHHANGTTETADAGEIYYWPEGHTATSETGAVFLEIGPTGPMRQFSEHARKMLGERPVDGPTEAR